MVIDFLICFQENIVDPFVIYNGDICYSTWRGAISEMLFGKNVDRLSETTQVSLHYQLWLFRYC